jgi:predicted aspartyl protease
MSPGGFMLIDGSLNNSDSKLFLLDSGASGQLILDTNTANDLKLKKRHGADVQFEGLDPVFSKSNDLREVTLRQAKQILVRGTFPTTNLENLSTFINLPIAGIIGVPLLSRYVVKINYSLGKLSFFDPQKFHYEGSGAVYNLLESGQTNLLIIRGNITLKDGSAISMRLFIDTGFDNEIVLNSHALQNNPSIPIEAPMTDSVAIGQTAMDGFWISTKNLQLDAITVKADKALVLRKESIQQLDEVADAGLGEAILSHFTIIVDRSHGHVILEPVGETSQIKE